jgi:hypothetical protein
MVSWFTVPWGEVVHYDRTAWWRQLLTSLQLGSKESDEEEGPDFQYLLQGYKQMCPCTRPYLCMFQHLSIASPGGDLAFSTWALGGGVTHLNHGNVSSHFSCLDLILHTILPGFFLTDNKTTSTFILKSFENNILGPHFLFLRI